MWGGRQILETDTDWYNSGRGGCVRGGRGTQNGACFGRGEYWLLCRVASVICWLFKWRTQHEITVSISPYITGIRREVLQVKRRKVSAAHIQHHTTPGTQARAELNTWADNSCGGTNSWLHKLIGESCSMSLFSASYDLMQDVHIATCLRAYTDKYGQTWILVFN